MALFSHTSNRNQGRKNNHNYAGNGFTRPGRRYGADMIGLGIFHDDYRLIANPVEAHNAKLQELITSLPDQVGGRGTNLTAGLLGAVRMADRAPAGCLRRVWVLSDGDPNTDVDGLYRAVDEARKRRININTIGFGNPGARQYDPELLKRISKATHNGRFVPVDSLRSLSRTLVGNQTSHHRRHHRQEITVMSIDCSLSMNTDMEGKRRIDVVVEALTHLLHYKQQCFS
jgi:hypothetical protein